MKTLLIIGAALLSVGCATTEPQIVKVPVPVPCKTEDPVQPQYRFAPPYDNMFDATRDLLGDRELSVAYENELRTALKSCK